MSRAFALLLPLALGAACALLVACGSSEKLLPGDTAKEIQSNLDTAESLFQERQCEQAADAAREVMSDVRRLPRSVDRKLRRELRKGAANLIQLIETECVETTTETVPTTETFEPPVETQPPVETEPKEKKPKEPRTPEPPQPQDGDEEGGVSPPGQEGGQGPNGD